MLDMVDEMIIGGGMSSTFLKAHYKMKIGESLFDKDGSKLVPEIMYKAKNNQVRLDLPVDFVCGDGFSKDALYK